jgi:LysR family glycine cleavage system transcriptional activator
MRRLPPLNALRTFEAAARHASFNAAADELFVTPSAVSHQIKSLEQFLDQKLFQRGKRGVELTASGEKYLVPIRHALDEIDAATRLLQDDPNTGIVTLSVAPAFLTRWLMPRLIRFQELYPDIELRLSASLAEIDFNQTDIDLTVRFGRGKWPDMSVEFLLGMSVVPVCSPGLMQGKHPLLTPGDMRRHRLIHVSTRMDEWRAWLRAAEIDSTSLGKDLRFSSTSLATGAAIEGLGIALADRHLVTKELKRGDLVIPFDITLDTNRAFYLASPKDRPLSFSAALFRAWILKEVTETVA